MILCITIVLIISILIYALYKINVYILKLFSPHINYLTYLNYAFYNFFDFVFYLTVTFLFTTSIIRASHNLRVHVWVEWVINVNRKRAFLFDHCGRACVFILKEDIKFIFLLSKTREWRISVSRSKMYSIFL